MLMMEGIVMEADSTAVVINREDEIPGILDTDADIDTTEEQLIGCPKIMVIGTGGAGNNSVSLLNNMGIHGAEIIAVNTDLQALQLANTNKKILIGKNLTQGRGAGGDPEIARRSMEVSRKVFEGILKDTNLLFVIAGMGGGTGTGSAPILAQIAKDAGAIVIAIVTTPFNIERDRCSKAKIGVRNLRQVANSTIVLDNNKLMQYVGNKPINEAFGMIDQLIAEIIVGVTETITEPSLINLDFADLKSVMNSGGTATILYGEASTLDPETIIRNTINNPLYSCDFKKVTGALVHITSGANLTLKSTELIANGITKDLNKKVEVIIGARLDPCLHDRVKVIAILTGLDSNDSVKSINKNSKFNLTRVKSKFDPGIDDNNLNRWDIQLIR